FPAARLDAFRPPLRVGSTRAVSVVTDTAFQGPPDAEARVRAEAQPSPAPSDAAYMNGPPAAPPVVVVNTPPEEVPAEVDVPVPVSTGIIVVSPPASGSNPPAPHEPVKPKIPDPEKPVR